MQREDETWEEKHSEVQQENEELRRRLAEMEDAMEQLVRSSRKRDRREAKAEEEMRHARSRSQGEALKGLSKSAENLFLAARRLRRTQSPSGVAFEESVEEEEEEDAFSSSFVLSSPPSGGPRRARSRSTDDPRQQEVRKEGKRKSKSPKARMQARRKRHASSKGEEKEEKEEEREGWQTMRCVHAVTLLLPPTPTQASTQAVAAVAAIAQMAGLAYYAGTCAMTKHGEGSYRDVEGRWQCGRWQHDLLASSSHQHVREELQHLHVAHSPCLLSPPRSPSQSPRATVEKEVVSRSLLDRLLPEELRVTILSFLDLRSLLAASRVSREWQRLTRDPGLWWRLHVDRWGEVRAEMGREAEAVDWRGAVKGRFLLERNWQRGDCLASTLRGHSGWVTCVDLHTNKLVSSSYDGTVRIWNTQTGNWLQTLGTPGMSPAWCVKFKEQTVMAGYSDSKLRQWDMNTGQCTRAFEGHAGGVKCLQYDESTRQLLSGSDDKTVKVFDVRTGKCSRTIQCGAAVGALEVHNDVLLTVIKRESEVYWHDMRTGRLVQQLEGHSNAVYCLTYDAQSRRLVTGSRDKKIFLWDMQSGRCEQQLTGHEGSVMSLSLAEGRLVSASADQTLKIWDVRRGRCTTTLPGHTEVVMSVSVDSTKIVSGSADKTVVVWDFLRTASG